MHLVGWLLTDKMVWTKTEEPMQFLTFEDETGLMESTFFPRAYRRFAMMTGRAPISWRAGGGKPCTDNALPMEKDIVVLIKGAGEMASGVAWRLHMSHCKVVLTDTSSPLAVRRAVSFCEAVYEGTKEVEGVTAELIKTADEVAGVWAKGRIPLLVDPELESLRYLKPDVLVDATLAKRDTGMSKNDVPLVVALGPGFEAGRNAHYVVETNRGHNLGRLYETGYAAANTGVPGSIAGKTWERVLRSPATGIFESNVALGDSVAEGQTVALVDGKAVKAGVAGILRGLIRTGIQVEKGLKVGDVDPRGEIENLHTISDKARSLGGAVLEAILRQFTCNGDISRKSSC